MSDWLEETLDLKVEHCENCGEGDSDWCDDCNGCRYEDCDTCTCEREFSFRVTYYVTVEARSRDDIDSTDIHRAVEMSTPDDWEED